MLQNEKYITLPFSHFYNIMEIYMGKNILHPHQTEIIQNYSDFKLTYIKSICSMLDYRI